MQFSVIRKKDVKPIINNNILEIIEIIKKTYLAHEKGDAVNPNSCFLRFPKKPNARIIALPAFIGGEQNISGIKWIASNPDNIYQGLPRASAVMILNDYKTGCPVACMEGSLISAVRTAASAVLSARYLKNQTKHISRLGIVGTGNIAIETYKIFMADAWDIKEIYLYDKEPMFANDFAQLLRHEKHKPVQIVDDINELLKSCDLILFATSATKPYISDPDLFMQGAVLLNISLRDLDPKVIVDANNVVDDIENVMHANTSPHLAQIFCGHDNFINGNLTGLMNNEYQLDENKFTVFSPMGMGILDIALGDYIYQQLQESKKHLVLEDFFTDQL